MIHPHIKSHLAPRLLVAVIALLVALLGYNYFQIVSLKKSLNSLRSELSSTTAVLSSNVIYLTENLVALREQTAGNLATAEENINAVRALLGGVEQTVGSISGTVGDLQKLSNVDKELLQKYSKVYFMNENYVPKRLTEVPPEYLYSSDRGELFVTEAWPHLKNLLDTAKSEGVTIYLKSAYRSFAEQKSLKSAYSVVYGAGKANAFSADQGYSEHQLGTTVDFITIGMGGKVEGFEKTKAYEWLLANAHRFGFVLSYPKGNAYYIFEPWHWRYVGVTFATFLHNNKLNFYDLEQRQIDTYLLTIFD